MMSPASGVKHQIHEITKGSGPNDLDWNGPFTAPREYSQRVREEVGVDPTKPLITVTAEAWAFEIARHRRDYRVFIHGLALAPGTIYPRITPPDRAIWLLSDGTSYEAHRGRLPTIHHPCAWYDDYGDLTFSLNLEEHEQLYREGRITKSAEVLVVCTQITYGDSRVFAERRWSPTLGTRESIVGLEHEPKQSEIERARRAFKILDDLSSKDTRGKHHGDGANYHSNEALLTALDEAICKVQRSTGRANPDARLVMRHLNYEKSAFYAHVKRVTGKRWRNVAAEYETRGIKWN